ncbi:hypothetical protein GCM10023339_41420 [Alloalcanivorax gelatiniphagus]
MPYKTVDGQSLEYLSAQMGYVPMASAVEAYLNTYEAQGYRLVGILPSYPVKSTTGTGMATPVIIMHKDEATLTGD